MITPQYPHISTTPHRLESLVTELRESKLSTEDSLREVQTRGRGEGETFERVRDKLTQDLHTEKCVCVCVCVVCIIDGLHTLGLCGKGREMVYWAS